MKVTQPLLLTTVTGLTYSFPFTFKSQVQELEKPLLKLTLAVDNATYILKTAPITKQLLGDFKVIGSSGVPAMHAALMPNGEVAFLDKVEDYTELKLPNGQFAYASMYNLENNEVRAFSITTNAFCSGGSFLADNRLVNVGGNAPLTWLDPTVGDGFDAIRYLSADSTQAGWTEPGHKLASKRWYASAQTLADGKVFVAAGSLTGLDPLNKTNNNPTYEVLDRNGVSSGKSIIMDILQRNMPYWMYPFLHLLRDGTLFIFTSKSSQVFDVASDTIVKELPDMPGQYRTYPNTGGSVMLPLSAKTNFDPEIMICGGGMSQMINSPTDPSCGRIHPLSGHPEWSITSMPEGRGMVEGVLLLDGTVLWLNGAKTGAQGFGIAKDPALDALIYNPEDGSWATAGTSEIARLYHSVALLLLDGTVLVAGSNPNEMPVLLGKTNPHDPTKAFPTEFRIEIYTPPYLQTDTPRPTSIRLSKTILRPGLSFSIEFETRQHPKQVEVILYHGGFVTHAVHMGQVIVYLDHQGWSAGSNGQGKIEAYVPKIALAPGPYVIYVVVDGVPGFGQFVTVSDE